MALSFEDSKKKYADYIARARETADKVERFGYNVKVKDDNELEATYEIGLGDVSVATLWWNVPAYLEFTPHVPLKEDAFSVDYVKSYTDWSKFLTDIENALEDYAK